MKLRVRAGLFVIAVAAATLGLGSQALGEVIEPDAFTDGIATNNNCTLREAVQASNENIAIDDCPAGSASEIDRIFLDPGHYGLDETGDLEDQNLTGDLDVTNDAGPLWIRGAGMGATFVDSEMDDRVFDAPIFDGDLSLLDLTATGNGNQDLLGGGVIQVDSGVAELERVRVEGGDAQFGGGVYCLGTCEMTVTDSVIRDNQATVSSTGFPGVRAEGGGMNIASGGDVTIKGTAILGNEAIANDSIAQGGGLATSGDVRILNSTIAGNAALSSTDSTAVSSVRQGAGIFVDQIGANVKIVNSTISQNNASSMGNDSAGGGVHLDDDGKVTIVASTLGNNNASVGTAMAAQGGKMTLRGSIIAAVPVGPICGAVGGKIKTRGYNILEFTPVTCLGGKHSPRDEVADPLLGGIALDNGGPTATYALPPGSPAINFVPKKKCKPAKKEDQRGTERPAGKACDAGSYERTKCGGELVDTDFDFGTSGNDNMSGLTGIDLLAPSAGNDKFSSFDGNDVLCGGSGDDTLKGGNDDDTLIGGKGKDKCDGGPGNDSGKSCEKGKSL